MANIRIKLRSHPKIADENDQEKNQSKGTDNIVTIGGNSCL